MKLIDINDKDFNFIYNLTSNHDIIKHIENGKVWDQEKTKKFIKYSIEEQKLSIKDRFNFYYIITDENNKVGVIGFFKQKDNNYYLRIFLDSKFQGQGYFTKSLNLVKELLLKYKKVDKLYAEAHQTNIKMNQILKNKYYFNRIKYYGKIPVNQYIIFLKNYTYLVKSEYISEKVIDKIFKEKGNWIKSQQGTNIDYIRLDGKHYFDKNNRKYKAILKNIVNDGKNKLTVKSKLIKTLGEKSYIPKTFIFDHVEEFNKIKDKLISDDRAWIFKPDGGYSGEGIQILRKKDFHNIVFYPKYKRWNLQEYIENPLLIDGKKFHLRVLFLYRAGSFISDNKNNSYWFKNVPVYLAKKKFIYDNFEDEEIHISHYNKDQEPLYLHDLDFTKKQLTKILMEMKKIMNDLANNLNAGCYQGDCQRCYEIFGVDLMIDNKYDVKLIEFNSKVGFKEFIDDKFEFNKNLLESELEITADYFLPPKNKIKKEKSNFILIN